MTFSDALEHARQGGLIARPGWGGTYVMIVDGSLMMVLSTDSLDWVGTSEDILADDWSVVYAGEEYL